MNNKCIIIMIEGCDKSGKSTLINVMVKKFPGLLLKNLDRPKDASEGQKNKIKRHYWGMLKHIENDETFEFIFLDRFYLSEMIYSVKRGYDAMEDPEFGNIEKKFKKFKHLFVFCNPGRETIIKRLKVEPDEHVNEEENLLMLGRYKKFYENTTLNKMEVDTNRPIEYLIKVVGDKIKELK